MDPAIDTILRSLLVAWIEGAITQDQYADAYDVVKKAMDLSQDKTTLGVGNKLSKYVQA
jgi:Arc/MetJ-type ribon-helix-helix transcriptional regulator